MYRSTKFKKFLLIWRTSDFEIKFAHKNMNEKIFEKINVKTVISMLVSFVNFFNSIQNVLAFSKFALFF